MNLWLQALGAKVTGYALAPHTEPSMFALVNNRSPSHIADIRDERKVRDALIGANPQIVIHMAAQALVRESYRDPLATYATNVLGTGSVLQACRALEHLQCVLVVTSDKVYENHGEGRPFVEGDRLGGHDPYSNSKACAELLSDSFRDSFFADGAPIATVRAGNVIGGGDWSQDRLIPDCVRALQSGEPVALRYPEATRPWQHVLEPLCGYLLLAEHLHDDAAAFGDAWNFGPSDDDAWRVGRIASFVVKQWGQPASWCEVGGPAPHESGALKVDASRARAKLSWAPRLRLPDALAWTIEWHRRLDAGAAALALTDEQLARYCDMGPP